MSTFFTCMLSYCNLPSADLARLPRSFFLTNKLFCFRLDTKLIPPLPLPTILCFKYIILLCLFAHLYINFVFNSHIAFRSQSHITPPSTQTLIVFLSDIHINVCFLFRRISRVKSELDTYFHTNKRQIQIAKINTT